MKELENLNLTENDFKLITDGLEALPNANMGGELMVGLLGAMLGKDDPEAKAKFDAERKAERVKADRAKQLLIEDIRILQGKILSLQRLMRMSGLLKDASDIINI